MREFKSSSSVLVVLLLLFSNANCVFNTFVITPDELSKEGSLNEHTLLRRRERDADIKHDVALKVNNLNDTHQQLIVHWVGEGSSIIICLARDSKEVTRRFKMPSAVYYSYDYGETFENKTDLFKTPNGTFVQLDKFYIHTKIPSRTIFTDSANKMIFVTEDHGKTFKATSLDFVPNDVSILQSSLKVFLIHDKTDPAKKLYLTPDFGFSWTLLQERVKSFEWFSEDGSDRKNLIVQREEDADSSTIIRLKSPFTLLTKFTSEPLLNSVIEMSIKGDYIFAKKNCTDHGNSTSSQNKDLFIKYKSSRFVKATFASVLERKDFFIADITENRVMVAVHHTETLTNLYVSDIISETSEEINFSLSMERIFCHFPNGTWKLSPISGSSDTPFADLHKVEGLRGIYIASSVLPSLGNTSNIAPEHLATRITFNWGTSWHPLNLTQKLVNDSSCQPANECSLHLSQKFALMFPSTRQMPILTSKSAPGIILASGIYGKNMKGHPSVYMSRDAGVTFKQVLKENVYFNMGDHGGILVAIRFNQKPKENVSYIMYSTDMGESWQQSKLSDTPLRIYSLMTEPGENTTTFSLFGSPPGNEHHWVIVKADFRKVFNYNCTDSDFKVWTPYNPAEKKMNCVLGRKEVYKRRIPNHNCYIGLRLENLVKAEICPCDRADYMCDDGFQWDTATDHCIRNRTSPSAHYEIPKTCSPHHFFYRTKGYKKNPGDVCDGGIREYEYEAVPCPLKEEKEFLLLAQKDRIVRFQLENLKPEVLPLPSLQNVIAVEYDMKSKCVFYADIVTDVISKWCFESGRPSQTVVDSRLHSVEGMAYDWISHHLYFVDGVRAKIEVVRIDVENSNRYRRTVINNTIARKPRGIAVHPVAGYMFWTDWIAGAPSIYRANLDGSNPTVLFTKPVVEWPNGIAVDFIAERIYWVDAREDYIAASDFSGKGFKKIIEHDQRVSHPFSVAIFKDNMYWDDWRANAIFVADKDHGQGSEIIASGLPGLMDLKVFAHSVQEGVNGCSNHNCSHMCFGLPNNKSVCACPDDLILVDNKRCVCPGGAEPLMNGRCLSVHNTCAPNHFRCTNGQCLPNSLVCDGDYDCQDHGDENQCEHNLVTCEAGSFRCGNGRCITKNWRCDHDFDCPDHSDETGCQYPSCKSDQFACDNGRCIAAKWRCDFENDCRDGSDERNCNVSVATSCHADEFKCPGGKDTPCIPTSWLCDGEPDCPDGTDEKNCTLNKCDDNRFQCSNSKKCIFWMWRCDGEDDCGDNSDETNCTVATERPIEPSFPSFPCSHMTFQCNDKSKCIPLVWKCDRVPDCADGSDELGCGSISVDESTPKLPNRTHFTTCGTNSFMCASGNCIPRAWVCDGLKDCPDGEEEKYCEDVVRCKTDGSHFRCRKSGECIDTHLICNGVEDCADGSDEGICDWSKNTPSLLPCPSGYFRCNQVRCEPLYKRCDNVTDCLEETDELNCTGPNNQTYQVTQLSVDKTFDEGVLITWVVQPPPPSSVALEYLPSISLIPPVPALASDTWFNESAWTKYTYHRFDGLSPYSAYNVTVYVRDAKLLKVYPPAYYLKLVSGKGVPSPPREVSAKVINSTPSMANIEVSWIPPIKPNGEIKQYIVNVEPPYPAFQHFVDGKLRKSIISVPLQDNVVDYKISVSVRNEFFESAQSVGYSLILSSRLFKNIVDLRADSPTDTSITLSWKPQKPNLNYTIKVSSLQTMTPYPAIKSILTNETTYTVIGLSPGVKYLLEVSVNKNNSVWDSHPVVASTSGLELPRLSNVSVVGSDEYNKSVTLRWDSISDERKKTGKFGYGVYYGVDKFDLVRGPKEETNSTSLTISDLSPCTFYLFDVGVIQYSLSQKIFGALSGRTAQLMTGIDPQAPPAHVRVTPDASAQPNVTISWTSSCNTVNRPVGYLIRIVETITKEAYEISVNASTDVHFKYTFGAKFGCHYNLSVTTTTQTTKGKWIEFETTRIPPPFGAFATFKKGRAKVHWLIHSEDQSLKNVNYSYEVLVSDGAQLNVDAAQIYNTSDTSLVINDLRDDQRYLFAVRIVMPDGRRSELSNIFPRSPIVAEVVEAPSSTRAEDREGGMGSGFTWLFIICVAFASGAAGFIYWKRKRSHISSFEHLSHYNTRSGSTTFSGVNGLDLDDTPEIREHFSDDEPLVIA